MKLEIRCENCSHPVAHDLTVWLDLVKAEGYYEGIIAGLHAQVLYVRELQNRTMADWDKLAGFNAFCAFFAKCQDEVL
jgi:hypothetical protein